MDSGQPLRGCRNDSDDLVAKKDSAMPAPKALIYDVFGTLVDWRTSVAREAEKILAPLGTNIDWSAFADAWRARYQPSMEEIRAGRAPYVKLDVLHRQNLEYILPQFGIAKLDEATLHALNLAWHRLTAWPDVAKGMIRLRKKFLVASCSNGNIAIMADLAKFNGFAWDAILGADVASDFKPKPRVYLASAEAFNLAPSECMMCAAHSPDLAAAAALGLQTAHIARPNEFGPNTGESAPTCKVDLAVRSVEELADTLGA
jgi:2-haloacid dehalogenase